MTPMLIQIQRLVMQPKVWRIVGFTSAVVGLLCYALSSSFNHLFGKWNLFKIFLYSVFSFITSLMVLYANIWQHSRSRSLRFKAHTAFFVLTITSVYSFFSDKVMNGKPDAYSLISCAAFAIMSLSLSRQTQCGFEVDLLYFFLGCLIVQLMKIKFQLAVVGAGFSYRLIILRSSFSSIEAAAEIGYTGLQDQNSVVIEVDSIQLSASSSDIASMMQQLTICMKTLQQESSNIIIRLLEQVKEYLEDKRRLIGTYELAHIDRDFVMDSLPSGRIINDLQETVKLMMGAGFEKECFDVYSNWRRGFLHKCLIDKLFELRDTNIEKEYQRVQMIYRNWMVASEVAFTVLFPIERRLCDRVFSGFSVAAYHCFIDVCKGATCQLLNFADAIADGNTLWHLFIMIDTLEQLRYLIPKFQSLFPDSLVNEAIAVKNKLGEASRDIFMESNNLIFLVSVAKEVAPADGQQHPMAIRVMRYLDSACRSRGKLEQILQEYPKVANEVAASSSFISQMELIMVLLESKLIAKSKNYKDTALRYLFMMNNRSQIESLIKHWELGTIFGDDWFPKNQEKIQHNLELYKRSTWNKVLDFLKLDYNESVAPNENVTAELLIEKLNLFNRHFEDICRVQSTWSAYDEKLREEIIISVGNILLPAYGIFIGKFQDCLGNQASKYIEYGMFEIEDRLNHLFLGKGN